MKRLISLLAVYLLAAGAGAQTQPAARESAQSLSLQEAAAFALPAPACAAAKPVAALAAPGTPYGAPQAVCKASAHFNLAWSSSFARPGGSLGPCDTSRSLRMWM